MEPQHYFKAYEGYFWQWEEDEEVFSITNGITIAYYDFIRGLLEKLCEQGLPPFGSILLALIATGNEAYRSINNVDAIVCKHLGSSEIDTSLWRSTINFLRILANVPAQYKQGNNRVLLLQTLFADSHNMVRADDAKKIVRYFQSEKCKADLREVEKNFVSNFRRNEYQNIALLSRKFPDVATILERMAALPVVEVPELEPQPKTDPVQKDLIDELVENSKTFYVGALVKRFWSGLNIPYHNYLASHQPVGGVSDLTNKGEMHRLLISEFANDDLIFLSRLANNEALYINREIPPQHNDQHRIILVDITIKNWGTPKLLAYAVALAIAKHPKTDIACSVFAIGNGYHPVSFENIHDIIRDLQYLDAGLHPGAGIELFFKEQKLKKAEVFLIASKDSFRHPAFHKAISDHYSFFNYWIETDAEGNIDLFKRQQNSRRHVQHIQLPLQELWKKPPVKKQEPAQGLLEHEFPILLPEPKGAKKVIPVGEDEIFLVTPEKSLLRNLKSQKAKRGWELVKENIPLHNSELEIGINSQGEYLLLAFNYGTRFLEIINLITGDRKGIHFNEWKKSVYNQFVFHDGRFYYCVPGYASVHWTFELGEEILVAGHSGIPKHVTDFLKARKEELTDVRWSAVSNSVLKNVTSVYINQLGNLVFNIHELRLVNNSIIKLEKTNFKDPRIVTEARRNGVFVFPDGSKVTVNRAGVIIFESSDSELGTFYLPSVVDSWLGVASEHEFVGNDYYYNSMSGNKKQMNVRAFWSKYIAAFIDVITYNGTTTAPFR